MKIKWVKMYLDIADRLAQESHAVRLKVGAVFVSPDGVMSTGINGMPAGSTNECENKVWVYDEYSFGDMGEYKLETKKELSHAEENLFGKLMRQGVVTKGGSMFLTHEPCINCSKIIVNAGIEEVFYRVSYKGSNPTGKEWLRENGIFCESESFLMKIEGE